MKIKSKKTIIFALVAALIFILLGVLYARYITDLLTTESRMHLSEVATQGAASVQRQVARDFDMLEILADGRISDPKVPLEEKLERIKQQADKFDLFRIGIVDLDGNATTSDGYNFSVSDREFFKHAVKGEAFLSQPIIDKVDKVTPGIVYAVPVYHDNKVVSVLFSGYELSKLTERIDITFYHESGIAFIADSKSNILLHPTKERIGRNLIEVASVSNDASNVKTFKENLSKGERGVARFILKEEERFFAYAPIEGANDWFLITSLPTQSVFERSKTVIFLTILLIVGVSLLFALIFFYIAWSKRKSNEKIIKMAYFDKLTDSPNIERFKLDATALFKQFENKKYTLLNFDVNQFRYLNNDLGYAAGNDLIIHIANCLKKMATKDEAFARIGIDQFVYLMKKNEADEEIQQDVERLRNEITSWQPNTDGYYSVQLSIGIYKIETLNEDIRVSIEKSNIARKAAKLEYETKIAFYDENLQRKIDIETDLEKAMPKALENNEFKLFIQPKYDLLTEKIVGGEALVRWIKPNGTMIMPNDFISLFEKTGAISAMDLYMMEKLCEFLRSQMNRGVRVVPVSINQSRRYMYSPTYVDVLCDKLKENDISAKMIELEITENLVFTDMDKLMILIDNLHEKGFRISLDDFGSGYSSLNILKDLQVDTLKLDRFMLSKTLDSERGKSVVTNIIRMAKELNMAVVAEGVETKEQVLFLRGCGCETAQGYYYSKPISAEQFEKLLSEEN